MRYGQLFTVLAVVALGACGQNDAQISQRVQERLAAEGISPNQVHVTTDRRVVTLEGVVEDAHELNRVEMAARSLPGIMGVDNRLVVKRPVNVTGAPIDGHQP